MPNWCECWLGVEGPAAELARFLDAAKGENNPTEEDAADSVLWFDSLLPTPPELLAGSGWYDWRVEHWGTKWNAECDDYDGSPGSGRVGFSFLSAWSPPEPLLKAVARDYPSLAFTLEYAEGGMDYSGRLVLRGGRVVSDESGAYGEYAGEPFEEE